MLYYTISELSKCHDSLLSVPLSKEVTQKLYTEKGNHIEYQLQNVDYCASVQSRLFFTIDLFSIAYKVIFVLKD